MTYFTPEVVISGKAYEVVQVGGSPPSDLGDFLGATTIVLHGATGRHELVGQGTAWDDEDVRFYEKAGDAGGKDVRVWRVSDDGGRFRAVSG